MDLNAMKICRVCGDIALCFNFNGLSCEACKVFFRRGVKKDLKYKCKKDLKCAVSVETRKICKRCRMDKCYQIGMKRELVLGISSEDICVEKQLPQVINDSKELQPYDMVRIGEIRHAMNNFPDESTGQLIGESKDFVYISNLTHYYVKSAIKYCKQIEAFKQFQSNDQIAMLKSFFPEMSSVYMSFIYDPNKNGMNIIMNDSGDKTIFFKLKTSTSFHNTEIAEKLRQFATSMNISMENDATIRNLIIAQLLFKPRDDSNCPEFVKYNYSVYCHLLQKYLLYKFKSNAERKFNSLMSALTELEATSTAFQRLYSSEMNRKEVNPILAEMFNLK